MDQRGIIIADRDAEYRKQMAEYFERAGYKVETTDSTVHVICSILEKQTPVLLLGSDFDQKVSSADLVHLLKKANRNLVVIMVSENMSLPQIKQVRQEGIFYHALKPADSGDTGEIGKAVECAFEARTGQREEPEPARQEEYRPAEETLDPDEDTGAEAVGEDAQLLPRLIGLAVLVIGLSLFAIVAAEKAAQGSSIAVWVFLAFAGLIVVNQTLRVFRIKLRGRRHRNLGRGEIQDPFDPE